MALYSCQDQPLPRDSEARLASFTELLVTAIANAESRAELAQMAEEQATLRRVATLVARRSPPEAVFAAVIEEVGRLFRVNCHRSPAQLRNRLGDNRFTGDHPP